MVNTKSDPPLEDIGTARGKATSRRPLSRGPPAARTAANFPFSHSICDIYTLTNVKVEPSLLQPFHKYDVWDAFLAGGVSINLGHGDFGGEKLQARHRLFNYFTSCLHHSYTLCHVNTHNRLIICL